MPHFPALILALVLTTYWGRVLRLVYKIHHQTGRAAHLKPPEPLGLLLRLLWVPIVIIWISLPYLAAFVAPDRLPRPARPLFTSPLLAWLSATLAIAALAGTLACWKKMGKSWRMGIDPAEKTQLVVTGPYAYLRHPIYALSSLIMLATIATIPSPFMLAIGIFHLSLLQWEARREEKHLTALHGQPYVEYCLRVGRFIPRSRLPFRSGP